MLVEVGVSVIVGVVVIVPVGVDPTTIFTDTVDPKRVPLSFTSCQYPIYVPAEEGAVRVTEMSVDFPEATDSLRLTAAPLICDPLRNFNEYEVLQAQVPVFLIFQVFVNVAPAVTVVPSGIVTSDKYTELSHLLWVADAEYLVGVR